MKRKDYKENKLKNPFFKKKKKKINKKTILKVFIVLASLTFLIYLLFFSKLFNLTRVTVNGTVRVSEEEIEQVILSSLNRELPFDISATNLFFIPRNDLIKILKTEFDLEYIEIKKRLPNRIVVNLKEREAAFILKYNDYHEFRDINSCPIYLLDVLDYDKDQFPILISSDEPSNLCISLADNYINDIIEIYKEAKDFSEFSVEKFYLIYDAYNIHLKLKEGSLVYLSRKEDFKKQLNKLMVLVNESRINLSEVEYVDVRYGDKAYVNFK